MEGVVRFEPLSDNRTRVNLELEYDPQGVVENVGDALGFVSRRVEGDLERFKTFIEWRGTETEAWRGEIRFTVVERLEVADTSSWYNTTILREAMCGAASHPAAPLLRHIRGTRWMLPRRVWLAVRPQRAEQTIRFVVGTGRKVDFVRVAAVAAVPDNQAP
jgi:hypothetical protein